MQTLNRVPDEVIKNASACFPVFELYDDRLEIGAYATPKTKHEKELLQKCTVVKYLYENDDKLNKPIVAKDNREGDSVCTIRTMGSSNKYQIGVIIKLFCEWKRNNKNNDDFIHMLIPISTDHLKPVTCHLDTTATWNNKSALQINFVIRDAAFIKFLTSTKLGIGYITEFKMIDCLQAVVIKEEKKVATNPKARATPNKKPPRTEVNVKAPATKRNHNNVAEEIVNDDEKEFQDKSVQLELELDIKKKVSIKLEDITITQRSYDKIVTILQSEGISVKEQTKTTLILN